MLALKTERENYGGCERASFHGDLWPRMSAGNQWAVAQRAALTSKTKLSVGSKAAERANKQSWQDAAPQVDHHTVTLVNESTNIRVNWMKQQLNAPSAVWKPRPRRPSTAQQRPSPQPAAQARPATAVAHSATGSNNRPTGKSSQSKALQTPRQKTRQQQAAQHGPVSPKVMTIVMGGRPRSAHPRLKFSCESPQEILSGTRRQRPQTAKLTRTQSAKLGGNTKQTTKYRPQTAHARSGATTKGWAAA